MRLYLCNCIIECSVKLIHGSHMTICAASSEASVCTHTCAAINKRTYIWYNIILREQSFLTSLSLYCSNDIEYAQQLTGYGVCWYVNTTFALTANDIPTYVCTLCTHEHSITLALQSCNIGSHMTFTGPASPSLSCQLSLLKPWCCRFEDVCLSLLPCTCGHSTPGD